MKMYLIAVLTLMSAVASTDIKDITPVIRLTKKYLTKDLRNLTMDMYENLDNSKNFKRGSTGLVYNEIMTLHKCPWDDNYPECPQRLISVWQRINELGLAKYCLQFEGRDADDLELTLLHDESQIEVLKSITRLTPELKMEQIASRYDAIYFNKHTLACARFAAGSALSLVSDISSGVCGNGMAVIRPPGHHAESNNFIGYCYFNNIALAAKQLLQSNKNFNKILIVDWDIHHGQATQKMFYDDPRVLYFSIHRYEHGSFWPNLRESNFDFIGNGHGKGFNINVPLNKTGLGDGDYLAIFQQLLLPVALEFQPDFVLISAGYDSAIGDEKGEMLVTPACYSHLIWSLMNLAFGRIAVILEGGYCIKSLAEGAALTLRALTGGRCPKLQTLNPPSDSVVESVLNAIYVLRDYWKCLKAAPCNNLKCDESAHVTVHSPRVIFRGPEEQPTEFKTRNCYPVQDNNLRSALDDKINTLIADTQLGEPGWRVCVGFDERTALHKKRNTSFFTEDPRRVLVPLEFLEDFQLLSQCNIVAGYEANISDLELVHSSDYTYILSSLTNYEEQELAELEKKYESVYLCKETLQCASIAVGTLLNVVNSVMNGDTQTGFALIRPPGHHATVNSPSGFCIVNNVAVAAKYAVEKYKIKRVLIVDWDVHHGDGTQEIFYEDPRILYISIHRFENASFFPKKPCGNYNFVGNGAGTGFNVNIPWSEGKVGDSDYIYAFMHIVLPIAYEFSPDLVLVSAGFDAADTDLLGGCKVTPQCFGHLTHWLCSLAGGRVILALEGGYNITAISYCIVMCMRALLGDPLISCENEEKVKDSTIDTIQKVISVHKKFWKCLKFTKYLPSQSNLLCESNIK